MREVVPWTRIHQDPPRRRRQLDKARGAIHIMYAIHKLFCLPLHPRRPHKTPSQNALAKEKLGNHISLPVQPTNPGSQCRQESRSRTRSPSPSRGTGTRKKMGTNPRCTSFLSRAVPDLSPSSYVAAPRSHAEDDSNEPRADLIRDSSPGTSFNTRYTPYCTAVSATYGSPKRQSD